MLIKKYLVVKWKKSAATKRKSTSLPRIDFTNINISWKGCPEILAKMLRLRRQPVSRDWLHTRNWSNGKYIEGNGDQLSHYYRREVNTEEGKTRIHHMILGDNWTYIWRNSNYVVHKHYFRLLSTERIQKHWHLSSKDQILISKCHS